MLRGAQFQLGASFSFEAPSYRHSKLIAKETRSKSKLEYQFNVHVILLFINQGEYYILSLFGKSEGAFRVCAT
jgi:hypothetical protein